MTIETLFNKHKAKVRSQTVRVTLFGEYPHDYCRISSSGLNLTCEGLLLGMRARGHGDPPSRSIALLSESW
jgi:hypothetical protein